MNFITFLLHVYTKPNFGIELELTNFAPLEANKGFSADFVLNKDVNYNSFGLMKLGEDDYNDSLISNLNNEFSMASSQKKGNNFNITRNFTMYRLNKGIYFFLLEAQDGNSYRSNQFHTDGKGKWLIKKSSGVRSQEEKAESFLSEYKYYIIGIGGVIIGTGLVLYAVKSLQPKK